MRWRLCAFLCSAWVGVVLCCAACGAAASAEAAAPELLAPADGAVTSHVIPSFRWQGGCKPDVAAMPSHVIQIARDREFRRLADEDRIAAVIAWYVPDKPLLAGDYWWRVACVDAKGTRGAWSGPRKLTVTAAPEFRVRAGATFEEIRKVVATAAAKSPARVVFDKGVYRLAPAKPQAVLELTDVADLTIDGNGAEIVFTRPAAVAMLVNCRRVLIRGFTFDYDPPPYTTGRVVAVDRKAGTVDADILSGHSLPDAHPAYDKERKGMVVTEADQFAMKRGVQLLITHDGFQRISGRRYRFRFERRKLAAHFAPGDVYVLDPRWYAAGGGTTVRVCGGEDAVLYDVTIRAAANECLNSYYADRHALLHVRIERKNGRALSVNNGGNNHHNARQGPWIEGCLFENTGDDICHVNGLAMGAAEQPAPNRLVLPIHQPYDQYDVETALDFRKGDRVQFFDRSEGRLIGERRVVSATRRDKTVEIVLDKVIEGLGLGRLTPGKGASYAVVGNKQVTQIFNASRGCNQFVFRHNTCLRGRRVGVLAKGWGGLIEHNRFEALGGGGVEFWNAPFEGLGAEDYVIRSNRIVNCLRLARTHAAIWCSAFKPGGSRIHRNLLIEDNDIIGEGLPALNIGDAENVILRNNRMPDPTSNVFRNLSGGEMPQ